jgi:C4-dicarboxylate-specific signal transduction histidine kinase
MIGSAAFDETRTQAVSFVLDLTKRRRSEEALQPAHTELAHISCVRALGELASIAHGVNQPRAAIMAEADACRNWLAKPDPPLELVREAWPPGARTATGLPR